MKKLLLMLFAFTLSFQIASAQETEAALAEDAVAVTAPFPTADILVADLNQYDIVLSQTAPGSAVAVYDVLGNLVMHHIFRNQTKVHVDLTNNKQGVYFIKVVHPGDNLTKRVVVK